MPTTTRSVPHSFDDGANQREHRAVVMALDRAAIAIVRHDAIGRMVVSHATAFRAALATPPPAPHREPLFGTWRTTCAKLAQQPGALRPWERKFVAELPNFPRINGKQRYILYEIAERLGVREPAR